MTDARLDLNPLTDPIGREEVRAYRERATADGSAPSPFARWIPIVLTVVVAVIILVVGLVIVSQSGSGIAVVFVLIVGAVAMFAVAGRIFTTTSFTDWARIDRFARANGMAFAAQSLGSDENGMIFGRGHDRTTSELTRLGEGWLDGRVETANYRYSITTGSGKNRHTTVHRWSYLVIQLDRNLPQLVLDALQNDKRVLGIGASDLPASYSGSQRLSLEGDFDKYFRLYAPQGYERDALYVLTPDLMALLVDQAGSGSAFDVEIIDDRLYLYAPGRLDYTDPAVWQRLTTIVRTVGAKTLKQTVRYADDRVGDRAIDAVAPEGRRLRSGSVLGAIVVVVAFAAVWIGLVAAFGH